ncbi:acetyl/propionyl/methylcrotonyl-CoA carboxylase subunit alpha [Arthrobacter sp. H14]|uniref:acetyl/propionyl/methylcrotonyl-CoA carboxylase subunit alpha n=1 Tax=Arthrobacter sp. H14 TaxID=1312959 RepID=UPI00047A4947|nr:biotin carboxylase N-terminal domain-containing protein [Arthrobacter sp. H14]
MHKVLIANRGEIAVRVERACLDAELVSVAVYADDDAGSLHVDLADEAYALDGSTPAETYLNIDKLLQIARRSGADAVHPGYGFLSENADFARAVIDAGLTWIGPEPDTILALGNKVTAREIAVRASAPMVAGSDGPIESAADARAFAEEHGLPLALKAAFGGGGRGLRVVRELGEIEEAFDSVRREAKSAFGRDELFVERFLDKPRHVEAQILADKHGNVIVVGTRDCSLQRRHQKLVEEAPAPFLTDAQRSEIHESAKAICREADYVGAGTVEFLLGQDGTVSFLEVNTRLQVEHPVTEETSGMDLVQAQFSIAAGEPLAITEDPKAFGHAIEFRLNAEDVGRGFLPSPGTVKTFVPPTGRGIRVDTGVRSGDTIAGQFDSMFAKLIVTGADRQQAIRRARRALEELEVTGLATVVPFHRAVLEEEAFTGTDSLGIYTGWIESEFADRIPADPDYSSGREGGGRRTFSIDLDGRRVSLGLPTELLASLGTAGSNAIGTGSGDGTNGGDAHVDPTELRSPMSGTVVKWLVEPGAEVGEGDAVVVLEAMKMESTISAHRAGTVGEARRCPADAVESDAVLTVIS